MKASRSADGQATQRTPSEEDASATSYKRRRVSKTCNWCRQCKLKCNGAVPSCRTCLEAKRMCSYGTTVKRRGLRTGYVRALECLWGLVFQSVEGSETTVERLISSTSRRSFWFRDDIRDGPKPGESPEEAWKSSRIPQALDSLLTSSEDLEDDYQTSDPTKSWLQTKDSSTTWALPSHSPTQPPTNAGMEGQILCQRCRCEIHEQTNLPCTNSSQSGHSTLPELPQNPQRLLDSYFALTHSWFPIVERHAIYKSLYSYRKALAGKNCDDNTSACNAVLWAAFAYAALISDAWNQGEQPRQRSSMPVEDIYMTARNFIPLERTDDYAIGHVQALTILALFHYSSCEWGVASIVTGQATLLASHIGFDQEDNCQNDHHQRVWLACFLLDTLTSAHTGKAPRLRPQHVQSLLPLDDPGDEDWEPWHLQEALLPGVEAEEAEFRLPTYAISVFNQLLRVLCLLNDQICISSTQTDEDCMRILETWHDGLPEHIKAFFGDDSRTADPCIMPPNILNLHMVVFLLCSKPLSPDKHQQPSVGTEYCREGQNLIHGLERFLSCFNQRALPPLFHLTRTMLHQETTDPSSISEVMSQLKRKIHSQGSAVHSQPPLDSSHIARQENNQDHTTSQYHDRPWPTERMRPARCSDLSLPAKGLVVDRVQTEPTVPDSLDDGMEQSFAGFMDMPGSWSNLTTDLLLDPQAGPSGDLGSHLAQFELPTAGSDGILSQSALFGEDATLNYFSAWDDLEM